MAALITASVSDDSGNSFDVLVGSRSLLRWEQAYPGRSMSKLNGSMRLMYELIYVASKSQIPEGLTLGEFGDRYDIEVQDYDEADQIDADPTQSAA